MKGAAWASALLALGACKHKPQPSPPPPERVAPLLQVVSVSPRTVEPDTSADVAVFGSGFASGAAVSVGDIEAVSVRFKSDNQLSVTLPPLPAGDHDLAVTNPDQGRAVLRGGLTVAPNRDPIGCEYVVLYFETNQSALLPAAERTLGALVECYQRTDHLIRVSGHADERGTTDYNLSLSYSRALGVQSWLVGAGIPRSRLPVTSYGEERPAVTGWGEPSWAQNRRVELTVDP